MKYDGFALWQLLALNRSISIAILVSVLICGLIIVPHDGLIIVVTLDYLSQPIG